MNVFVTLFAVLFWFCFEPFSGIYSIDELLYIFSIFVIFIFGFHFKQSSRQISINTVVLLLVYFVYFIVSRKLELFAHITDIRTYLISKQLLVNTNSSLKGTVLSYYQQLVVVIATYFYLGNKKIKYLGIVIILFEILTTGTRSFGIYIVIPFIVNFVNKNKWRIKHYFIMLTMLFSLFYVSEIYSYYRSGYQVDSIELESSGISFASETRLAFDAQHLGEEFEDPFVYMIVSVIPRALWHDKPMSSIVDWYTRKIWGYSSNTKQGTVLPGVVAQLHLGGGWCCIFELAFFIFLCRVLVLICENNVVVQALLYCGLILSLRMLTLSNFLPFFISIFLYRWKTLKKK